MSYYNPVNPADRHTQAFQAQTAYLFGLGPLPGPTAQQQAVAQMQAAMDSVMFDHIQRPDNSNIDPTLLALSNNNHAPAGASVSGPNRAPVPNITVEVQCLQSIIA
ncbi:hypothetical protein B0H14DRAFT_3468011 [Mycena olivaceomarginata]|nr:hypothetical protein B0H14DRAFT_3468011 [Mycena olivaceomarginata]